MVGGIRLLVRGCKKGVSRNHRLMGDGATVTSCRVRWSNGLGEITVFALSAEHYLKLQKALSHLCCWKNGRA